MSAIEQLNVLEAMSVALMVVDQHGKLLYVNSKAEHLLGRSRAKLLERSVFAWLCEVELLPHNVAETLQGSAVTNVFTTMFAEAVSTLQPVRKRDSVLMVNFNDVLVDYSITPVMSEDNRQLGYILIEISELGRIRAIEQEKILHNQQKIANQMVRGMAHEIKNPLAGIRGAAQLLTRKLQGQGLMVDEYTNVIVSEVDRLSELVSPMMGQRQFKPQPHNIHELLEYVRKLLVAANTAQAVIISRDYDLSLPEISIDKSHMLQVLLNLTQNAMQALLEAQVAAPNLRLRTRVVHAMTLLGVQYKQVMRIDIIDNGPGIAPEMIDHLFFPMVSGRSGGTGLGLSIAMDLVQWHKGNIVCQSANGLTTFSIYLPWIKGAV